MNTIRSILASPWLVDYRTANAAMPLVMRLLKGEEVTIQDPAVDHRPYAYAVGARRRMTFRNFNTAPSGSVAVFPVHGVVTKEDGWCSMGTVTLMKNMSEADEAPNIVAHLLEIDSGGGEGTNIETVARFIRGLKKPVVAWFNGTAASAAYWIAAAADRIYAGESTDMVGSIGVYFRFADMREHYEALGIKVHEVYASQSELKNDDIRQAMEGNYESIRAGFLDPYAQAFINSVQSLRPGLKDEDAYKGKIFMAAQAVENGMIDGIMSLEQALEKAASMGEEHKMNFQNTNNINMKRIESILGYEIEIQDGGVFLREDELLKLDRFVVGEGHQAVEISQLEALEAKIDEVDAIASDLLVKFKALAEAQEAEKARLEAAETAIDELKGKPGDLPARAHTTTDTPPAPDALDAFEQAVRSEAQKKRGFIG